MPRILDFFDGFVSNTQPSLDGIQITSNALEVYASDAAYEATNGPGAIGDIYTNSTTGKVRFHNGTEWDDIDKGGVGYQEKVGTGNSSNTQFPLTLVPSSERSILVFANRVMEFGTEWTYNDIGNQIEFVSAPATSVDIYVFYLTEGDIISVPVPSGTKVVEYHEILAAEETAKEFTLAQTAAEPTKVIADVIGATSQQYSVDFVISSNKFNWNGLGLDGSLTQGDVVRLIYFT